MRSSFEDVRQKVQALSSDGGTAHGSTTEPTVLIQGDEGPMTSFLRLLLGDTSSLGSTGANVTVAEEYGLDSHQRAFQTSQLANKVLRTQLESTTRTQKVYLAASTAAMLFAAYACIVGGNAQRRLESDLTKTQGELQAARSELHSCWMASKGTEHTDTCPAMTVLVTMPSEGDVTVQKGGHH